MAPLKLIRKGGLEMVRVYGVWRRRNEDTARRAPRPQVAASRGANVHTDTCAHAGAPAARHPRRRGRKHTSQHGNIRGIEKRWATNRAHVVDGQRLAEPVVVQVFAGEEGQPEVAAQDLQLQVEKHHCTPRW